MWLPRPAWLASHDPGLPTILQVIVTITAGVSSILEKAGQYTQYWERKYRPVWEQDKARRALLPGLLAVRASLWPPLSPTLF